MADRVDLVGLEAAAAHVDEDGGGGLHAVVGEEQAVFGLDDHHARGADPGELADGAGELALQRAQVVGALDEIAEAELALVEDFKANALPARQALGGEIHAELVDALGRDGHGGAAGGNLVRDVLRLQVADDGGGVLVAEARVEQLVIGPARPEHDGDHAADDGEGGHGQRHALVEAELRPEGQKGGGKFLHERRSGEENEGRTEAANPRTASS